MQGCRRPIDLASKKSAQQYTPEWIRCQIYIKYPWVWKYLVSKFLQVIKYFQLLPISEVLSNISSFTLATVPMTGSYYESYVPLPMAMTIKLSLRRDTLKPDKTSEDCILMRENWIQENCKDSGDLEPDVCTLAECSSQNATRCKNHKSCLATGLPCPRKPSLIQQCSVGFQHIN